jgi:hypothetical protein
MVDVGVDIFAYFGRSFLTLGKKENKHPRKSIAFQLDQHSILDLLVLLDLLDLLDSLDLSNHRHC